VKHKILIIIFLLTILSQRVFTQTNFRFGPELGVSLKTRYPTEIYGRSHNSTSQIRPLIGITGQFNINNHFLFSSGFQYEMIGSYWDTVYTLAQAKEEENLTFQKICIPIKAEFAFNIKKIHPSLFIGFRPNFLVSGNLNIKYVNSSSQKLESDQNPFDPNQFTTPANRFSGQFTFGLSNTFSKVFKINLICNSGNNIEFYWTRFYSPHSTTNTYTKEYRYSLKNSEYAISLIYLFKLHKTSN